MLSVINWFPFHLPQIYTEVQISKYLYLFSLFHILEFAKLQWKSSVR